MVFLATVGTSNFLVTLPSPYSGAKGTKYGGGPMNLGGLKSKHVCSDWLQVKVKAQAPSNIGTIVTTSIPEGSVSRQNFSIKSYEIDADRKMSIQTMMKYLQETVIHHHFKTNGVRCNDLGCTPQMCKKDLIWVTAQTKVVTYRYPTWGDDVQGQFWVSTSGKIAVQMNWLLTDCKTGEILIGASSVWVMMNKLTRRLSKIPEEVRREFGSFFVSSGLILEEDNKRLSKLKDNAADYISTSFSPRWSDLDVNQHVNNVKYIDWIVESVPLSIMESHELSTMTLEYKRECSKNSKLQSLISISDADDIGNIGHSGHAKCKCNHLLRLEDGTEIMRGRTEWRPKLLNKFDIMNSVL